MFNLAIDSKLRGCDLVAVRVDDVAPSGYADRATIRQKKTGRPVKVIARPPSSSPSVGQHSRHVEELKGIISDAFAEVAGKAEENY